MWEAYTGLPPDVKSTPEPPGSGLVVGLPEDEEGHQPVPSGVTNDDPYTYEIQPNMATILCAKVIITVLIPTHTHTHTHTDIHAHRCTHTYTHTHTHTHL